MMVKDVKKEEEVEKEEKEKKEKEPTWFNKVPVIYKISALAVIIIRYQSIVSSGGSLQELWVWVGIALIILYFLGSEGKRRDTGILTPQDAMKALKKEMERKMQAGEISRWAKVHLGPDIGMFRFEGMPRHYQIEVEIVDDLGRHYKRGIVDAAGDTIGYVTLIDSEGKYDGRTPLVVRTPKIFQDLHKKYDVDYDSLLFGKRM
jgi:hypothetical protein